MSRQKTDSLVITDEKGYRLPRTVMPENYRLSFEPDFNSDTFIGDVAIDVHVIEPTDKIVLNAKELEITNIRLSNESGAKIEGTVSLDTEREFATIKFAETIKRGRWQLSADFKGIHNDKLKGFYRSTWIDNSGAKHKLVSTQLESTDARRAFPCFDEPDMKATFAVSLVVPEKYAAVSNGRPIETKPAGPGKKLVRFRKTMKMSTYLVAMIVGELEASPVMSANGIDLCVWTVPGKSHLTGFALKVAAFTIDYFEKYFRVRYPDADKCDLLAIPDFAAGAMENKDCITFRETALLVDEAIATHGELERVAEVVMHELAHMWFGDLVTMKWWNGLWLNEAFATFMEVKALDAYRKDWNVWDTFGIGRAAAARVDALKSTHPIECPVNRPEEVHELFDVISYRKGCAVLYQIEQFIGEEVFRNGITHYLNAHAYDSTETYDLWDSLEWACKQAGLDTPVRKIMDAWVFTAGHPMVSVSSSSNAGQLSVEQQQFQFLADAGAKEQLYPVPLTLRVKSAKGEDKTEKVLFSERQESISVGDGYQSVVANAGGSGFYRVRYDQALAKKIAASAQKELSVIERFNLVNDAWASVRAGLAGACEYLDLIRTFAQEDDINVWLIITGSIHSLHSLLSGASRIAFKGIIRQLYAPQAAILGWEAKAGESVQAKQLRGHMLDVLGTIAEDKAVVAKAIEYFDKWKKDKKAIEPNLLPALVNILAYNGDAKRYEEFRSAFKEAKTPQETIRFLYALAAFRQLPLLETTMANCVSDEIKTQDAPFVFGSVVQNEIATESGWKFMKDNWETMAKSYPESGLVRMCSIVLPALDNPALEEDAKHFFAARPVEGGAMAIAQGLEMLRINVLLRGRESEMLAKYALA